MKKNHNTSIAFFGTPRFAVFVLEELEKAGIVPDIIVTQPDKPAGRGLEMQEPPVKSWAVLHDVPVVQDSGKLKVESGKFDLFVVVAYGKILPKELLAVPHKGTLNVHPSLLPKFRGPSPIESQILADDKECGVTIMLLDDEVDHGPIIAQASISLNRSPESEGGGWPVRASILEEILAREGGKLLAEVIPAYLDGSITPEPQDHSKATFTKKISKEDGLLDLSADGHQNYLKFCAYDEWPGTFFFNPPTGGGKRIKIVDAVLDNGLFKPLRVIPEGKKEQDYKGA
jgi:methionyl-tRNA formyltransferase